ncbi:FtsW/RodA/SpoVE family cell cycle protein [Akkermansia glycaniphila]|uniref:Probable peptidoglycan glycosyltransferase FtsW n=1 Tax=Akkermansia glycaniphila TaxID=1679444 RepID=A0A1H6LA95_9BACT|nr:putative peptidoglycan glycosyltransferase FtsW [Akkermansia glycaniphila]MBT9448492.1 cell division protein FtsW [Akkermansia glycaniphila]SEH81473.1 cell cycle protein [Akkermansia glycaniphila]
MTSKISIILVWSSVIILLTIGLMMVASTGVWTEADGQKYELLTNQVKFALLGLAGAVALSCMDYRIFRRFIKWIWLSSVVLLVFCFLPGIGYEINGEYRWVRFGSFQFQPSECAKICLMMTLAHWYATNKEQARTIFKGFILPGLLFGVPLLLILVEKDMGTAASLAVAGFGVMYVAGVRWWLILGSLVAGAFVLYATTTSSPNRMLRIYAWEHPEKYSLGAGRQQWLSMLAFSHGGIKGAGLGEGVQKHGNLPFAHTDFIFAEIGEELGFVGAMGVVLLFSLLAFGGIAVALQTRDPFGRLLAVGIVAIIFWPAMLNVYVVTSLVPNSGLPLPFTSCGGTSLVFTLGAIGILTSIQRFSELPPVHYEVKRRDINARVRP